MSTILTVNTEEKAQFVLAVLVAAIRKSGGSITITNEELGEAAMGVLTGDVGVELFNTGREGTFAVAGS